MKTAIVYYSAHHGNTKKLVEAVAQGRDVTLIDALAVKTADLSGYALIGFAHLFRQVPPERAGVRQKQPAGGQKGVFPVHLRRQQQYQGH